jgi:FtsZ-binding cell division protein ZapB
MNTLQKGIVGGTLAAVLGMGVLEMVRNSRLQQRIHALQQQQELLGHQVQQVQQERDDARNQLRSLLAHNGQAKTNQSSTELLKLRGEVTVLRTQVRELMHLNSPDTQAETDPMAPAAKDLAGKMNLLRQGFEQRPDYSVPELNYLDGEAWARVAQTAKLDTDAGLRQALSKGSVLDLVNSGGATHRPPPRRIRAPSQS